MRQMKIHVHVMHGIDSGQIKLDELIIKRSIETIIFRRPSLDSHQPISL